MLSSGKKQKKSNKEEILLGIIKDIFWMAIRYAHGRNTYAPHVVRGCYKTLKRLYPDFKLKPDRTITAPTPRDLNSPFVLREDYLDDLFREDAND